MKKRILTKLLTVVMAAITACSVFSFMACSQKKEITIAYWINNANEKANNKYIFDAFEAKFPEYKVTPVYISYDNFYEEVMRIHVGGTIPDVLWLREEYMPVLAGKGVIDELTPYVDADTDFDETLYFENALDFCRYDNKLYALPRDIGVQVIGFNLDRMYGEPLPSNDWTWDDMIALGQKLTPPDKSNYGLGWTDWKALIYSNGGRLFSDDGKTACFNEPQTVAALQMYSDLANTIGITPTAEASQGLGNAFTGKKASFSVIGPWDFAKLKKANINLDIRPFPKGPDGGGTMRLSGLQIGIASKCKQKDMAYELVKFLCYDDGAQKLQAQYSIAMPSIKSIAMSDLYTKSEYAPPSMNVYFEALANTFIEPHFDAEMEAINEFNDWLYLMYNNAEGNMVSAESVKNEMNNAVQSILDGK